MTRARPDVSIDAHVPELAWQKRGLCVGLDPEIFFPEGREGAEHAKLICYGCPVRPECLEYALRTQEKFGVWGGTSEHERRLVLRQRRIIRMQ